MATEGGRIDFMFLAPPPPYPASGSATALSEALTSVLVCERNMISVSCGHAFICKNSQYIVFYFKSNVQYLDIDLFRDIGNKILQLHKPGD